MEKALKNSLLERLQTRPFWICLFLHALFTLLNAKPIGDDSYLHPMWLELFSEQFRSGDFYPRWLFETYGSYGSPTFYLYPPLTYFFGAVISLLGITSGITLYNIIQFLALAFSGYTAYLLLREFNVTNRQARLGALVYAINPYHFVDVFARSALSEHVALAFLPLLFLGLEKLSKRTAYLKATIITLVAWMLLILTNIPTTLVAGIGALTYLVVKRDIKLFVWSTLALIGALALTAFYWLPAYHFSQFVRTEELWNIAKNTSPIQVIASAIIFAFLVLLALWFYRAKDSRGDSRVWLTLGFVAIAMQIPYITDWLYTIQPFKLVQFGWRFTMLAMLAISALVIKPGVFRRVGLIILGATTFFLYLNYGNNHIFSSKAIYYEQPIKRDAPEYTTKWVAASDIALMEQLKQTANSPVIASSDIKGLNISYSSIDEHGVRAEIDAPTSGTIQLHQFYWPAWRVLFNSTELQTHYDKSGLLIVNLPEGSSTLTATMSESPIERVGKWISLASIVVLLVFVGLSRSRSNLLRSSSSS